MITPPMFFLLLQRNAAFANEYGSITSRIYSTSGINIRETFFYNFLLTSGSGSAIYQSSSNTLLLTNCIFNNCTAPSQGGCIWASNGGSNISNCCYELCYITAKVNNLYGNVIYSYSGYIYVTKCSSLLCGPTTTASDSTFFCYSQTSLCSFLNFTECNGYGGSAGVNLCKDTANSDTSVSITFCHVDCSHNYCSFVHENAADASTTSNVDIINSTFDFYLFFLNTGSSAAVVSSTIFSTTYNGLCGYGTITFSNCYADFAASGISVVGSTITISIGRLEIGHCLYSEDFSAYASVPIRPPFALALYAFITEVV